MWWHGTARSHSCGSFGYSSARHVKSDVNSVLCRCWRIAGGGPLVAGADGVEHNLMGDHRPVARTPAATGRALLMTKLSLQQLRHRFEDKGDGRGCRPGGSDRASARTAGLPLHGKRASASASSSPIPSAAKRRMASMAPSMACKPARLTRLAASALGSVSCTGMRNSMRSNRPLWDCADDRHQQTDEHGTRCRARAPWRGDAAHVRQSRARPGSSGPRVWSTG